MQYYICCIQDSSCKHCHIIIRIFNLFEPFEGLFTQGMVCHETYKDKNNNWVSPDELVTIDGKKFLKSNNTQQIKIGPSESMSKI